MQTFEKSPINRLCIFAYYDKDGIIDNYIVFLLKAMRECCKEQIVVINGFLTVDNEKKIKPYCTKIIYRENIGYDITAFKEAYLSLENLNEYDEILFYNQTIFGPVCSLKTMFNTMAGRNVDFWGLSMHSGAKKASWNNDEKITPHIQSYFFAVRKKMFISDEFIAYWRNLPMINSYWDAVSKHEVKFTEHFDKLGFKWGVYLDTQNLNNYNDYPVIGMPAEMLRRQSPFIKRKSFLFERHIYSGVPQGNATQEMYDYIRTKTNYPVSLICENITRTVPPPLLWQSLSNCIDVDNKKGDARRTAAVFWFAHEPLGEYLCDAACKMQKDIAILCIFKNEDVKNKFASKLPPKSQFIISEMNGIEYLFKHLWKDISVFDNLLFCHNNLPLLLDEVHDATSMQIILNSLVPGVCADVLSKRNDIGALVCMPLMHQDNFSLGQNWNDAVHEFKDFFVNLNLNDNCEMPNFAVRGSMFIAKTKAISALSSFEFKKSYFEGKYPLYEYIIPLTIQNAGLLTAFACKTGQTFNELLNNYTLLQTIVKKWKTEDAKRSDEIVFNMQAILDFYEAQRHKLTLQQIYNLNFKGKLHIIFKILFSKKNK